MPFQKICENISDLYQDAIARLLESAIYKSAGKRTGHDHGLAHKATELADTAMAHIVAIGVLVKMESKMAKDAKDLLEVKRRDPEG